MGVPARKMRIMDDEYLFNLYYVEMGVAGSANKIQKKLKADGLINPRTGNPPTTSGIWQAINRHLVKNYQNPKIKTIVNKYYIDCGLEPMSEDEWLEMISRHAKLCFTRKQYRNWIAQHPDLIDLS